MNPLRLRKKAKHLAAIAVFALWLVTGCAHGKNSAVTADPGAGPESIKAENNAVKEAKHNKAVTVPVEPAPQAVKVPKTTANKPSKDLATASHPAEGVVVTEEDIPESPEEIVIGDDVDDFFDDGDAPKELPVTAVEALVPDPLIKFNRAMFEVNDRLYFWCLKPVAKGYKKVTPAFFRKGVMNFFYNLGTPVRLVGSVLQGKYKGAGSELGRFVVNTTVGVGGVWDPADRFFGLKPSEEDFGQTLGAYNIDNGCYIVWPFLGPSTLRDTVGKAGDVFLNPLFYLTPNELAWGLTGLDVVNETSYRIGDYETIKSTYMDPYVMIRDLYITHRKKKIAE
ncbi:MAG: VacJ family lipoprotein [Desulfobacteraceae bacterium]|jgi:phospholipid-binding lipoprotein MlaA